MKFVFVLLSFITLVNSFTYNDQKQNCSKYVTNTFCYDGPHFDAVGQYKSCSVPGTIAMTFDDGPSVNTPHVLDILARYNMKATFFIIGSNIAKYPGYIQRIIDEGHQIGAHTYNHVDITTLSDSQVAAEFLDFENSILQQNYTGSLANHQIPRFFRAPHGIINASQLAILNNYGLYPMHWSFLNGDSYITNYTEILPLWYEHMGGVNATNIKFDRLTLITQQHDRVNVTNDSFEDVAKYLYDVFATKGVRFVTLTDCFNNTMQAYQSSHIDPQCITGIPIKTKVNNITINACCSMSCGKCGGNGCSTFPGGSTKCCTTNIFYANKSCNYSTPPCIITP